MKYSLGHRHAGRRPLLVSLGKVLRLREGSADQQQQFVSVALGVSLERQEEPGSALALESASRLSVL